MTWFCESNQILFSLFIQTDFPSTGIPWNLIFFYVWFAAAADFVISCSILCYEWIEYASATVRSCCGNNNIKWQFYCGSPSEYFIVLDTVNCWFFKFNSTNIELSKIFVSLKKLLPKKHIFLKHLAWPQHSTFLLSVLFYFLVCFACSLKCNVLVEWK